MAPDRTRVEPLDATTSLEHERRAHSVGDRREGAPDRLLDA